MNSSADAAFCCFSSVSISDPQLRGPIVVQCSVAGWLVYSPPVFFVLRREFCDSTGSTTFRGKHLDCCHRTRRFAVRPEFLFFAASYSEGPDPLCLPELTPAISEIRHVGHSGKAGVAGSLKRAGASSSAGRVVTTGASAAALAVHAFALRTAAAASSRSGRRTRQLPRFPCRPAVWRPYLCSRFRPPGTPGPA